MEKMVVDTAVANLWTSPDAPRVVDKPILGNPVDVPAWVEAMSHEEQLALTSDNLVQSQALYGTEVQVLEAVGDWLKVLIPEQPSSKDPGGYPGWMVKGQLIAPSTAMVTNETAVVRVPKAWLHDKEREKAFKLSFQTRLPAQDIEGDWVTVKTPRGGEGCLRREDVSIEKWKQKGTVMGRDIIASAERFLGLPYVWGGMSAFGYDCSGFAHMMHRAAGRIIARDASDQAKDGLMIARDDLAPGDLLYFAYEEGKGAVHHVGIYYGGGKMIHAPKTGKSVEIILLAGSAYEPEFWGARRYHA